MKKIITKKVKIYQPPKRKYDPKDLKEGAKVEKEHTPDKGLATDIAKHHLAEDKKYYKKLKKIEKKK